MKTPLFTGSATALVTPFREGRIDYEALARLIAAQAEGGTAALVICGTTGEGATLSPDEHEALFRFAGERRGGMKIIAGIGSNDTAKAMAMARRAEDAGADGLLMRGWSARMAYVSGLTPMPVRLGTLYTISGRSDRSAT